MHKKAEEKLSLLREQQSDKTKHLLGAFYDVLLACKESTLPDVMGENVLKIISNHGGINTLHSECESVVAYHSDSYFPLLWQYFIHKRSTLFKLIRVLNLQAASQNSSLISALHIILHHAHSQAEFLKEDIDISFATEKWQKLIRKI